MILNLTNTPYQSFSEAQKLACHGDVVIQIVPSSYIIDRVERMEKDYGKSIEFAIVSPNELDTLTLAELTNLLSCPIRTLDVEIICGDDGVQEQLIEFEYEYD